eukprot:scaffold131539_cov43-Cyclotella_meneghiniana.AAC.7
MHCASGGATQAYPTLHEHENSNTISDEIKSIAEPLATTSSAAIQSIFDEVTDDEVENENENEHKIIPSPVVSRENTMIVPMKKIVISWQLRGVFPLIKISECKVKIENNGEQQNADVYVRRNPAWTHIFFTKKNPLIH